VLGALRISTPPIDPSTSGINPADTGDAELEDRSCACALRSCSSRDAAGDRPHRFSTTNG
jgi:hypothetical protein